jgi:hypothetical protein
MPLKYMVSRPDGTRTGMVTLAKARSLVHDQAAKYAKAKDRRMRLKMRNEAKWGTWRTQLDETMEAWERKLKADGDPGEILAMDIEGWPYSIGTRIIMDEPPQVQTEGNADIDKIFTWLVRNENGRNGGICNRRNIAGSSSWSQHSPWPPPDPGSNAVDWFASPDTMDELYEQAHRLAGAASREPSSVPVGLILVGSQKWEPGSGFSQSGAEYHRHLHIQGRRTRTGSPQSSC